MRSVPGKTCSSELTASLDTDSQIMLSFRGSIECMDSYVVPMCLRLSHCTF